MGFKNERKKIINYDETEKGENPDVDRSYRFLQERSQTKENVQPG